MQENTTTQCHENMIVIKKVTVTGERLQWQSLMRHGIQRQIHCHKHIGSMKRGLDSGTEWVTWTQWEWQTKLLTQQEIKAQRQWHWNTEAQRLSHWVIEAQHDCSTERAVNIGPEWPRAWWPRLCDQGSGWSMHRVTEAQSDWGMEWPGLSDWGSDETNAQCDWGIEWQRQRMRQIWE